MWPEIVTWTCSGNYDQAIVCTLTTVLRIPFYEVIGADISSDTHNTRSIVLGDVKGTVTWTW